jgi:hypothetical protein
VTLLALLAISMLASGCGSTAARTTVVKTVQGVSSAAPFTNVLVISVAGERASRAQFETEAVAALSRGNTLATAYFAVAGRQAQYARSTLDNAIRVREFDAVLMVREQGQDQPGLVPNRPTGRQFDLFQYDYEEFNQLTAIDPDSTVSFIAEVYDTVAAKKVWAIDSLIFETESTASAVSEQVAIITAEMRKDRLVRR